MNLDVTTSKPGKTTKDLNLVLRKEDFITTIQELKEYIPLKPAEAKKLEEVTRIHPMKIPIYYLSLINPDDENDPIRKIIVPSIEELNPTGIYDTSGEEENTKMDGLQHKYRETALLLATNRCAAYCRHCFRKRLIGLPSKEILKRFDLAIDYISNHPEIDNVLISGGDPFMLGTPLIEHLLSGLTAIQHLHFIRFGTRMPVAYPYRFIRDESLIQLLKYYSRAEKQIYIITHFNHPREITDVAKKAIDKLKSASLILNNQAVLLKGVNDNPDTLVKLMKGIVRLGINPYYVFHCRPVKRVKRHFQIPFKTGYEITRQAKTRLNGLAKRFTYAMSHRTGKVEIVGIIEDKIFLRYHQAKDPEKIGRLFKMKLTEGASWLDDLEPVS